MFCFAAPRLYPDGFNPVPDQFLGDKRIIEIREDLSKLTPEYSFFQAVKELVDLVVVVMVLSIVVLVLNGPLTFFSQKAFVWLKSFNWTCLKPLAAGFTVLLVASSAVFSAGAGVVIRRIIANDAHGKFSGGAHWQATFRDEGIPGHIDTSTLVDGTGEAFYYGYKTFGDHFVVSTFVPMLTLPHAAGAVAYHVARAVVIPFYILGCMSVEACIGRPLFRDQRHFHLGDIPKQWVFSIKQIVKAPFYGTAQIFAALYSYVSPLNGRKLGSIIEKEWNNDIDRSDGVWSVRGAQSKYWRPEGGGGPNKLGKNGFYLAGCWTPMGVVHFENSRIVSGESMTRYLHPERGKVYTFTTVDTLRKKHNDLVRELERPDSLADVA